MKLFTFLKILIISTYISENDAKWVLSWSDEFNGTSLNTNNWMYYEKGCEVYNYELECYPIGRKENARVENGHLVIQARVEKWQNKEFTSARLSGKKGFTFGRFDIRARLPKGKNLWPAIWMLPVDGAYYGDYPASGEIDIMEARGERPYEVEGTIHFGGGYPNNVQRGSGVKKFSFDFSIDYHVFSLEWDRKEIRWLIDNNVYHKENIDRNMWSGKGKNPYTKNAQPFDQPFRFILNIAIGGTYFPKSVYGPQVTPSEAKKWPKTTMEIDYVRVYRWEN